jgi:hypothetical protein
MHNTETQESGQDTYQNIYRGVVMAQIRSVVNGKFLVDGAQMSSSRVS